MRPVGPNVRNTPPEAILDLFLRAPEVRAMAEAMRAGRRVAASGSSGSSAALTAAAVARLAERPVILVVAHLDDADETTDDLASLGVAAIRLPALELAPGETQVSLDLFAERLDVVRHLEGGGLAPGSVLVAPIHALMQPAPVGASLERLVLRLAPGDARGPAAIVRWLDDSGYRRADAVEDAGDYAVRGGIVDVFLPAAPDAPGGMPVRLDFFGDELESISEVDLSTMGSDRRLKEVELIGASAEAMHEKSGELAGVCPLELATEDCLAILHETLEVTEQGRGYYERVSGEKGVLGPPAVFKVLHSRFLAFCELNQFSAAASGADERIELPARPLRSFAPHAAEAVAELAEAARESRVIAVCENEGERQRLGELMAEHAPGVEIEAVVGRLHRGFVWGEDASPAALVPHHELMHRFHVRRRGRRLKTGRAMDAFLEIEAGDYVVHADHGVAKFLGLKLMARKPPPAAHTSEGVAPQTIRRRDDGLLDEEHLVLEFTSGSKLYVPASQIEKVQKYVGGGRGKPPLSTLGGKRWQRQKEQTREAVKDLAAEMLRIQAAREHMPGITYPADTAWQKEFEAEFPHQETDDQLAAIAEFKRDMQSARPMDRIICGDVGYGKTEVAMRAAFKAAEYGKQVAVLAPTTVLVEQHERTFRERFAGFPFRVESVSRFKSPGEVKETLDRVKKGQVDVIVGTHRLLSNDVDFADLGLLVIDEEQRFGVEHKQKLLSMRMTVDVLTLSATPIPRTLHLALVGVKDISSLATAPVDRRAIVTEVIPYNERRLAQAVARELSREGQVFWVHNRVHSIHEARQRVERIAPGARIVVGHGQMAPGELEDVMLRFIRRDADILVSTTIIESGIDIATANTMIIEDADRFGLSELHQLRGRVGRGKHRAYCYLTLPEDRPITDTAKRRLRAIEEFSMLGAGFKIAMRDLEIRGAGNMLGAEQSGHIAAVGYELYCRLLETAVKELKHEDTTAPAETAVDIGLAGHFPKGYIPSDLRRMEAYRRLAAAQSLDELAKLSTDLEQAYGKPPAAAERLLQLGAVRIGARSLGVREIVVQEKDVILRCDEPGPVVDALAGIKGTVRPLPPKAEGGLHEVYFRPPESFLEPSSLLLVLRRRLTGQAKPAAA